MAQELQLLAPSGNLLSLGLPDEPRVSTVSSSVRFVGKEFARGFQVGQLGFQEAANDSLMPARVVDRFVVGGREVRLAVGAEGVNASVAMIGEYHELMTIYGGPPPGREDVVRLLEMFEVDDRPEGMAVRPRYSEIAMAAEGVSTYVDGRGTVTVPNNENAADMRPTFKGTPTRYGEVWRREGQLPDRPGKGANTFMYILGTRTAVAEVVFPDSSEFHETPHPRVSDQELLDWLYELNPRWGR
jgi:hypothetical protein